MTLLYHAELIVEQLQLESSGGSSIPGATVKEEEEEEENDEDSEPLAPADATMFSVTGAR